MKDYVTPQERKHFETDWPIWAQVIGVCVFLALSAVSAWWVGSGHV